MALSWCSRLVAGDATVDNVAGARALVGGIVRVPFVLDLAG